ncbi:MAG: hypothetical protein Unbinned221contig1000_36 [Prokaryotic dsDNA virus sp.]|nr:MAG: hypothetical protein Unbinned221contig1000_36 [Prokaryotic dsDNA virus sp.]
MRFYRFLIVLTLFSCSSSYHYQKALKKGLEPLKTSDTIRISTIDSIPVIYRDSIIYERFFSSKDTVIKYENVYVPKTRLEIRTEYKTIRDTLRLIERVERVKARQEARTERKNKPNWTIIIIFLMLFLGVILYFSLRRTT